MHAERFVPGRPTNRDLFNEEMLNALPRLLSVYEAAAAWAAHMHRGRYSQIEDERAHQGLIDVILAEPMEHGPVETRGADGALDIAEKVLDGKQPWPSKFDIGDVARALIASHAECKRLRGIARVAAEILRLNGLTATANTLLEGL